MEVLYAIRAGEEKQVPRGGEIGEGRVATFVSASWNLPALWGFPLVAWCLFCKAHCPFIHLRNSFDTHKLPSLPLNLLQNHHSIKKPVVLKILKSSESSGKLISSFLSHASPVTASIQLLSLMVSYSLPSPAVYDATVLLWCWADQGNQGGMSVESIHCK